MTPEQLSEKIGTTLGTSKWYEMGQGRIEQFADVTEDWQFINLDSERAAKTPFGGTVAHGYLTLSMLSAMAEDVLPVLDGASASVNYGFDRLRFLAPVPTGARLRTEFVLNGVEPKEDRVLVRLGVTMQIEDHEAPALVAEWLVMYLL